MPSTTIALTRVWRARLVRRHCKTTLSQTMWNPAPLVRDAEG